MCAQQHHLLDAEEMFVISPEGESDIHKSICSKYATTFLLKTYLVKFDGAKLTSITEYSINYVTKEINIKT